MRSSRSRSGSRASGTPLLASLALHAALFAALARMPRGETREAAALGFETEIAVAWVPAGDDAELDKKSEEEAFQEPAPLIEAMFTPPPPLPEIDPQLVEEDEEPASLETGELEPEVDPSFSDLPVLEDPPAEVAPTPSPPPSPWPSPLRDAKLADFKLPPRPVPASKASPPAPIGAPAPVESSGPPAAPQRGTVVAAVARSHGNAAPDYPSSARRNGIEGVVLLRVQIAADGTCSGVTVETSSGHESLDAAAVAAVRKWRFEPALQEGVAVASELLVPIRFVLKAGGAG
jgi:periplasmic protein TonB